MLSEILFATRKISNVYKVEEITHQYSDCNQLFLVILTRNKKVLSVYDVRDTSGGNSISFI